MEDDDQRPPYRTYRASGSGDDPIERRARARARGDDLQPAEVPQAPPEQPIVVLPGTDGRPLRPLGDPARRPRERPRRERPRRLPRQRSIRRPLLLGIAALLIFLIGWVVYGFLQFRSSIETANGRVDRATRAQLADGGSLITSPSTILLLGSDLRPGGSGASRSDSTMLVRIDPGRNRIVLLSIPRDLRVPIPGHGVDRINAAYTIGGPALAIATVRELTTVRVNHVAVVDFAGFRSLIDALGGVTVENPTKIVSNSFDGVHWRFAKGNIHLDGRHALAYARVRENTLDPTDTDISRGLRQQRVLGAIKRSLVSPSTLFSLPDVGRAIGRPLTTDLSASDLLAIGWRAMRSSTTLHCRLGGTITTIGGASELIASPENARVVLTFLGRSAPVAPAKTDPFSPGCS